MGSKNNTLHNLKVAVFIVSDENLSALNDFSLDVAHRIVKSLKASNVDVFFSETVLKSQRMAEKEALKMTGFDLDAYIIYLPTWIECPTAISIVRELEGLPFVIWGFKMWENERGERDTTGSVVGELVLKGTLERMKYEFEFIIGFPENQQLMQKVLDYIQASRARKLLKRARIGQLGYTGIGMYPGTYDHTFMRRYIGPEIVPIPECECDDIINSVKESDVNDLLNASQDQFDITHVNDKDMFRYTLKMYLGFKKVIEKYDLDGLNPRCHYDFSKDKKCTCCVPISLLSDEKIITGCEGDIVTSVTMMIYYMLSDNVTTYGDILDYDEDKNIAMFSACGYAPFSLVQNKTPVLSELEYDKWGFAGILSSNVYKKGKISFGRLFEQTGSYGFVYGTGSGIDTNLRGKMFPALNVELDGKVEKLIEAAPTQHFAFVYGDLTQRLQFFLRIMNIQEIQIV